MPDSESELAATMIEPDAAVENTSIDPEPESRSSTSGLNEASIREIISEANEPADPNTKTADQQKKENGSLFSITFEHLTILLYIINALLILTATLYCLTILFSLKISLLGRLGGINHICRAFFLSLLFLIFILPWQNVFGSFVIGAIYSPAELVKGYICHSDSSGILASVLYYLRFSGYWVFILLLLFSSQLRSARWARAILRRLEII
jgi:hypothetical protein